MVGVRIGWNGKDALNILNQLQSTTMPQAVEAALLRVAEDAVQRAKEIVPVDTGTLQQSIRVLERGSNYVVIGSDVEYAIFIEFGTSKMEAQPFLGPATDAIHTQFQTIFTEEMNRRLR